MAPQISLASASVTTIDGAEVGSKEQLLIRGSTVRYGGAEYPGVASVVNTGRGRWTIRFVDGEEWAVRRHGGCGCGGRR